MIDLPKLYIHPPTLTRFMVYSIRDSSKFHRAKVERIVETTKAIDLYQVYWDVFQLPDFEISQGDKVYIADTYSTLYDVSLIGMTFAPLAPKDQVITMDTLIPFDDWLKTRPENLPREWEGMLDALEQMQPDTELVDGQ